MVSNNEAVLTARIQVGEPEARSRRSRPYASSSPPSHGFTITRPGAGRNSRSGSSAQTRASIAWPRETQVPAGGSDAPAALLAPAVPMPVSDDLQDAARRNDHVAFELANNPL
jgi:hypothetical protein